MKDLQHGTTLQEFNPAIFHPHDYIGWPFKVYPNEKASQVLKGSGLGSDPCDLNLVRYPEAIPGQILLLKACLEG